MFTYVIKGEGYMALPVKSELNLIEFKLLIKNQCKLVDGNNVWYWGIFGFVNPIVYTLSDFGEIGAALIGLKNYD